MDINPDVSKAITSSNDRKRIIGYTAGIIILLSSVATWAFTKVVSVLENRIVVLEGENKEWKEDYRLLFNDYKEEVNPKRTIRDSLIEKNFEIIEKYQ